MNKLAVIQGYERLSYKKFRTKMDMEEQHITLKRKREDSEDSEELGSDDSWSAEGEMDAVIQGLWNKTIHDFFVPGGQAETIFAQSIAHWLKQQRVPLTTKGSEQSPKIHNPANRTIPNRLSKSQAQNRIL